MRSFYVRHIFILLSLTTFFPIYAWENPSEKYLHAYKQYQSAQCPITNSPISHFVYFAKDRSDLRNHSLLKNSNFAGAQIMYGWRELEPSKDHYDFSLILEDVEYLAQFNKKLFIQLQDASFRTQYNPAPQYLMSPEYDGGAIYQYTDTGKAEGWVTKRWNPSVQKRFGALLTAMGKELDGKVAGVNLQETAIGIEHSGDKSFTTTGYVEAIKFNMSQLKHAFPTSVTLQYANFTPGEWLPWEDFGQLKSIYQHGESIGVGLAAPDLMVRRKGQLNHALAMMHEGEYSVPLGIAVQDGNYIGQTNSIEVVDSRENIVPLLHAFAKDFLQVNYMFWVNQEPYFSEDVLPCFISD